MGCGAPAGTQTLSPASLWAQSTCLPVACLLVGVPDVFVTVTFQGIWTTGFSKCPSVGFSLGPEAKQMAFSLWKYNNAIQTHTSFPFHCGGA